MFIIDICLCRQFIFEHCRTVVGLVTLHRCGHNVPRCTADDENDPAESSGSWKTQKTNQQLNKQIVDQFSGTSAEWHERPFSLYPCLLGVTRRRVWLTNHKTLPTTTRPVRHAIARDNFLSFLLFGWLKREKHTRKKYNKKLENGVVGRLA